MRRFFASLNRISCHPDQNRLRSAHGITIDGLSPSLVERPADRTPPPT